MIHEICTNTFRAESKCIRRVENTLPLALQGGEGAYIKNNSACAFKANTLFITLLPTSLSPGKKINTVQNKTWHKRRLLLGWARMHSCLKQGAYTRWPLKLSFQAHYSLGLSKHCLWRKIKYGWVFKWRKRQRLTDSCCKKEIGFVPSSPTFLIYFIQACGRCSKYQIHLCSTVCTIKNWRLHLSSSAEIYISLLSW